MPKARPTSAQREQVRDGVLANGVLVRIRPLLPSDRAAVAAGFEALSERSRFLRFLTGKGQLSETGLRALVDDVDQHRHVALAMLLRDEDRLVAVGRFVALSGDPTTADVAVTVADELHGQGAGTMLMTALAERARAEGVRVFTATMTADNVASHRMMLRSGRVLRDVVEDDLREIEVAVA